MDPIFEVHILNDIGKERAVRIADAFNELLVRLNTDCGTVAGREMAIVRTKLEEACFFAKKAMAIQKVNQAG